MRNSKPTFLTPQTISSSSSSYSVTSSAQQHKQALLTQINGRQVLLIPKQTETIQGIEKVSTTATVTAQMGNKETINTYSPPQYKIIRSVPIQKIQNAKSGVTILPGDINTIKEDDEPSKLEQCLRYGSAAVGKTIVANSNVSLPLSEPQHCIAMTNQDRLQSTSFSAMETVYKDDDSYGRQFISGNQRELLESMRRDSSDSGKSDIITSSTIDARLLPTELSHQFSSPIYPQENKAYQILIPKHHAVTHESPSMISYRPIVQKDMCSTNNIALGGSNIIRVASMPTNYNLITQNNAMPRKSFDHSGIGLNMNTVGARYELGPQIEKRDNTFNVPQLEQRTDIVNEVYDELDDQRYNLSVSSDSGFIDQSPNITPQSISLPHNLSNLYNVSSSQYK
jgi:hypothetical protein